MADRDSFVSYRVLTQTRQELDEAIARVQQKYPGLTQVQAFEKFVEVSTPGVEKRL